jgi:hypothetical protein
LINSILMCICVMNVFWWGVCLDYFVVFCFSSAESSGC